jgi:hypothetical protein
MTEHDDAAAAWVASTAAALRAALADPAVRAELADLLGGTDPARQARRLELARRELASMELRMRLAEEEPWMSD